MSALFESKCIACRGGEPVLTSQEIAALKPEVPEYEVTDVAGIPRLARVYKFKNFAQAMDFTLKVGEIAETEDHHPALLTEWGKVTVSWWTHKIKGLHRNDFIMAAKTDRLYLLKTE